ncbi:MAG: tetratricopeptide repeat protein [Polyangiaceae bacterium]|nr:tetratricopeptide repeat protein [Polyangiaceae bacterium]
MQRFRDHFLGFDPTFLTAFAPLALVAILLFTRSPTTNYIFDEQEALLANPYVNATGGLRFIDAIHRDFWGLPPDRSVGSYRPLPNFLWRALWAISKQPFLHHFTNVLLHAVNAALVTCVAFHWTRRRGLAYLAGFTFVACAVLTEAVSGIVGIADVLGGLGALLALAALALPAWGMPFAVFGAVLVGLFSKESALVCVPLVPFAALVAAPLTHPRRPARALRALLALIGAAAAFVLYVELRRRWFPSPTPSDLAQPLPEGASALKRAMHAALLWFHQAPLPNDPLNNPLGDADPPHRIAGALRVYWRGFAQVLFPLTLSGDYSYPQEPVPDRLVFFGSVAGAALTALPPLASIALWISSMRRERRARAAARAGAGDDVPARRARAGLLIAGAILAATALGLAAADWFVFRPAGRVPWLRALPLPLWPLPFLPPLALGLGLMAEGLPLLPSPDDAPDSSPAGRYAGAPRPLSIAGACAAAIGLTWIVVSFFPHSNIPVVLPTVRAERFWYFPAIGSSIAIAVFFSWLHGALRPRGAWLAAFPPALFISFFGFQCVQSYRHAMDYRSDLDFWDATRRAVPNSAKAHLNYSVMKGARGDLEARLVSSRVAMRLAPQWPMAHVYTGDTLCRLHRAEEAWPHYKNGFEIGPNELSLIALALQCLWDEKKLTQYEAELRALAEAHPGTWIAYLGPDTLENGETHNGVDPKYRPRGYNEGPKE